MRVMITGAAGNLGGFLARSLLASEHDLRLMVHQSPLGYSVERPGVEVVRADLGDAASLPAVCQGVDTIVHFAGVLFQPWPEQFLPRTNVDYVYNLIQAAAGEGVGKIILVSFPHVEGESSPQDLANGSVDGQPHSVHAQTRLEAEKLLLTAGESGALRPVILRPGMIYGRGVLMIETARRLMRLGLLPVWPRPTWIHLLALPDFLQAVKAAIEHPTLTGVVNLGDDRPLTLQNFLDRAARHWGYHRPPRLPSPLFYLAATAVEVYASLFRKPALITRDFIRIGMASYASDIQRMKADLLETLAYPTIDEGIDLL